MHVFISNSKNNEKIKPFYIFLVHHILWFVFVFFPLCSRYNYFKSDLVQFWCIYSFWHFFLTHFKLIRYFQGFRSTIIIPMNFHSQLAVFFSLVFFRSCNDNNNNDGDDDDEKPTERNQKNKFYVWKIDLNFSVFHFSWCRSRLCMRKR